MSTILLILAVEPTNSAALLLREKVQALENHVKTFEAARAKKDWGMARLALDQCLQAIEGEGADIPAEWRYWRVELALARRNMEGANIAANDSALRLNSNSPDALTLRGTVLFLVGRLPQPLQHVQHVTSALWLDPGHEPVQKLRKRVKEVERPKEEGNVVFKQGNLQKAVEKYSECLDRIGEVEVEGKGGQIRATLLLSNRATTLLKLEKNEDALADTNASLLLAPNSFKALRTRARIHLNLENRELSRPMPALLPPVEQSGEALIREPAGCLSVTDIMLYAEGDKSDASATVTHPHPIDLPPTSRVYKALLQGGHYNHTPNTIARVPTSS